MKHTDSAGISIGAKTVDRPGEAARLEAAAEIFATPCGDGHMAWRRWAREGADGDPVVLLHGSHGSWLHWVRNVQALVDRGHTVWVPDLPGAGDSFLPAGPADNGTRSVMLPVRDGLAQLLAGRPYSLVGFSYGALIAAMLAAEAGGDLRALVLVGATAMGFAASEPLDMREWRNVADPQLRRAAHRHNLAQLMLHRLASLDDLAVEIQAGNSERFRLRRKASPGEDEVLRILRATALPVAGIWGTEDIRVRNDRSVLPAALAQLPDLRGLWWIEGAAHWVQYDAAAEFDKALAQALAACGATQGGRLARDDDRTVLH